MPSKPVYAPAPTALASGACLLVSQAQGLPIASSILTQLMQTASDLDTLCAADCGAAFTARVQQWLAQAAVGARLYVCGDEAFVWQVHGLARQAGLLNEDIELFKCGATRKLFCVHCAALQDIDESTAVPCQSCGVQLLCARAFLPAPGRLYGRLPEPGLPTREARP
ncbi:dimethylamine monooxygenase subunit DmmA family protein [Pseudomonas aeruginosa]|nr:dimethylamine monooxygenase subunit DmmA family protein [Pseudomonas aeruginosa]